jgi:hypothetical protein
MFRFGPWLATVFAIALALVFAYPVLPCASDGSSRPTADSPSEKHKTERERCKRTEGGRVPRGCPDGGERLPQDKKSPLDSIPPLSPLVA